MNLRIGLDLYTATTTFNNYLTNTGPKHILIQVLGRDAANKPVLIWSLAKGIDTLLSEAHHKASLLNRTNEEHAKKRAWVSRIPIPPPLPNQGTASGWPEQPGVRALVSVRRL